jgi:hypothetical protein
MTSSARAISGSGILRPGTLAILDRPSVIDRFLALFVPISIDPDRSRGALVPTA